MVEERLENYRAVQHERRQLQRLRDQLLAKYEKLLETRAGELLAIETAIDSLPDPTQRAVLRYHYVQGLHWEDIAYRLHYSTRRIYTFRSQALKQLETMGLLDVLEPRN